MSNPQREDHRDVDSVRFSSSIYRAKWFGAIFFVAMLSMLISVTGSDSGRNDSREIALNFFKANAQNKVTGSKEVILVRVYDEHSQLINDPPRLPCLRTVWKGTVLQCIKGDWKVGETINFFLVLHEAISKDLFKTDNKLQLRSFMSYVGTLHYLFMDKSDKKNAIPLETGCEWEYSPELEALLKTMRE